MPPTLRCSVSSCATAVDAPTQQARLKVWEQVLKDLDGLDAGALSADNRINLAIYRPQVENLAAEVRLRAYEMPFNSDSSFWSNLSFMARPAASGHPARSLVPTRRRCRSSRTCR